MIELDKTIDLALTILKEIDWRFDQNGEYIWINDFEHDDIKKCIEQLESYKEK